MSKFAEACMLSYEDWVATFPEIIPEAEYTEKHEKWKKKLFDKMRGDRYHRFTAKTVKVMLVAAVISALLLTAFVIPSSREFIIVNLGIYSTYELTEDNGNSVNGEITVGYIPEGFELTIKENYSKHFFNHYESNDNQSFTVYKYSSTMKINFNTEDIDTKEFVIENVTYTYCTIKLGNACVMWNKNDYVYQVDGTLPETELLKIAETVK